MKLYTHDYRLALRGKSRCRVSYNVCRYAHAGTIKFAGTSVLYLPKIVCLKVCVMATGGVSTSAVGHNRKIKVEEAI